MIRNYRFWLALLAILALILLARFVVAAQGHVTPSPIRVMGIVIEPHKEMNGRFVSFPVTAVIQVVEELPSGEQRLLESNTVKFDLIRGPAENVDVAGSMRLYSDIAASLYAAVVQEFRKSRFVPVPDPTPPLPGPDRVRRNPKNPP